MSLWLILMGNVRERRRVSPQKLIQGDTGAEVIPARVIPLERQR